MSKKQKEAAADAGLWRRLYETRVIQTLAIYIPVAWVAVEILDVVAERFSLPGWVAGGAVVLFIAGIPVTAFLAWAFQWGASGPTAEMKGWRAGLVVTIAIGMLLGTTSVLMLNLDRETLLSDGDALTEPVAVVGVLPLTGDDSEVAGLADSLTLEISDRLAKHPDLYVIDSAATFSPQLAGLAPVRKQQALRADRMVTGSVSRDQRGYLLTLELLDGEQPLWRDELRFGSNPGAVNGVLERAGKALARELGVRYQSAVYCPPSDKLEALEAYHQARLKLNQRGPENLAAAERLLKHAISLDPGYGHAYGALSVAYLLKRGPENQSLAVDVARKGLDRCPSLGAAYKIWVPPYEGVENEIIDQELQWRDALAMAPNDLWMLDNYAAHLGSVGHRQAAMRISQRAWRNNPLDPRALASVAWDYLAMGQAERALELADEAERSGDNSCNVHFLRLRHYMTSGSEAEATAAWADFPDHCRRHYSPIEAVDSQTFYRARFDGAARRQVLDALRATINERPNNAMVFGIELGDYDLTFDAIRIGLDQQKFLFFISWWEDTQAHREFRRDPRFAEIVEEIGLVEYWREFGWPDGKCVPLGAGFTCDV